MKKFNKVRCILFLLLVFLGGFDGYAATTPLLGDATTYGILADTYTNTVPGTTINGDVGFTTPPAVAPGGVHPNYGAGAPYATAGTDQGTALAALAAQPCTFTFAAGAINLSTDITHGVAGIYTPGVYCSTGAMNIGGPLTLTGSGTYIFRPVGALTSTAGAVVTMAGASACDVFWTPTQATTLAANTTFAGTVIADAGITIGANTTWIGRALAFGGTVTTDTTTMTVPTCGANLTLTKTVINDNTGINVIADFALFVGATPVTSGVATFFPAAAYTVSETNLAGYMAGLWGGDCNAAGEVTLANGDDKICTITNDDIPPAPSATLTLIKTVINDNTGINLIADFALFIGVAPVLSGVATVLPPAAYTVSETNLAGYTASAWGGDCNAIGEISLIDGDNKTCTITNDDDTPPASGGGGGGSVRRIVPPLISVEKVPNPLTLPNGPGEVTYTYTVLNVGTVALDDVTVSDDKCTAVDFISGDSNDDDELDINETWTYRCTSALSRTTTNIATATGYANGLSTTDIANARVVVGAPITPPLIHVIKKPDQFVLPFGGSLVTYTYTVTNPGIVALNNVRLTDDKCNSIARNSGDVNDNDLLDTAETWVYTCRMEIVRNTVNTVTAVGSANGLTATDYALATVVVATPGLPNTGNEPVENDSPWKTIISIGLGTSVFSISRARKEKRI